LWGYGRIDGLKTRRKMKQKFYFKGVFYEKEEDFLMGVNNYLQSNLTEFSLNAYLEERN
jgi:hypothetical protein